MTEALVDVVIPLHRSDRTVEGAIASAQPEVQGIATRVLLVLHNLSLDDASAARLEPLATILRCDDGIPSPSGPRNVGLDAATAPFVFFLDSDDELAPDCLRRLHEVASVTGADVVLPSIRGPHGYLGTPLVTSRSPRLLDVVRDGLFFRSHSFALLRRSMLTASGLRYPEGIRAGQDLVLMARLYTTAPTAMAFDAAYLLLDHGGERVTTTHLPLPDQLAAVRHVLTSEWMRALPEDQRQALAHRILAVNLASGWRRKRELGHEPSSEDHAEMRDLALRLCPKSRRLLSVRDRITLRFSTAPGPVDRLLLRKLFGVVPTTWSGAVSTRGPFMAEARNWVVRHRHRRVGIRRV